MNRRSTVHGSFVARTSDLSVSQLIALLAHIMYQLVSNKHAVHPALSVSAAIYFHQAPPSVQHDGSFTNSKISVNVFQ